VKKRGKASQGNQEDKQTKTGKQGNTIKGTRRKKERKKERRKKEEEEKLKDERDKRTENDQQGTITNLEKEIDNFKVSLPSCCHQRSEHVIVAKVYVSPFRNKRASTGKMVRRRSYDEPGIAINIRIVDLFRRNAGDELHAVRIILRRSPTIRVSQARVWQTIGQLALCSRGVSAYS
jgi:hypothetical protein